MGLVNSVGELKISFSKEMNLETVQSYIKSVNKAVVDNKGAAPVEV